MTMVVRRKDGSIFKVQGPNPLMDSQDIWEAIKVHNFDQQEVITPTEESVSQFKTDFDTTIAKEPIDSIPVEVNEPEPEIKVEPEPEPKKSKLIIPERFEKFRRMFYCLPITEKKVIDRLYDEIRITKEFNKPFRFEAILLKNSDIIFSFWTNIEIANGSIIYDDRRWWRIKETEPKSEGYIFHCIPSDEKPAFN